MVIVPIEIVAAAEEVSLCEAQLSAARCSLDNLRPLEFGDRTEHGQRELVFRVLDVVTAIDDQPLPVLQDLANDDDLIRHIASDAISVEEIDAVEELCFQVSAQFIECRSIQPGPAVPVINVLFYQDITARLDLAFQDYDLALDRALFLLQI